MKASIKNRLKRLEEQAAETMRNAPLMAAIELGLNYSDLTDELREQYAQYWDYDSAAAYEAFIFRLQEFGVGCSLDEPLQMRPTFKSEEERTAHIRRTAAEIEQIFANIKNEESL